MCRQTGGFHLSVGAAVALFIVLIPGRNDTAFGQGANGFLQPTITADYLRAIRQQALEYDEALNESTDPRNDDSNRSRGRADDYGRSLFDFSRTEAARPRQYTTYDEVTRPSLFPGATETQSPLLSGPGGYEDYYSESRRRGPTSSTTGDLAVDRSTFNPYDELEENTADSPYRTATFQAGASDGRFGAQTLRLNSRALEFRRAAASRDPHDNLNGGLLTARLGAIAGLSYTDNATFQNGAAKQGDLIGQIGIRVSTRQQLTKTNMLNFQLGVGYTEYLLHPEINDIVQTSGLDLDITPTSRLAWETSLGNVFFTVFDSFGLSQRVNDDFLAAQETDYPLLINTLGMAASWQSNRTTSYTASISRTDRMALDPAFSNNDTTAYNFIGDIEYSPGQEWIAGRNQVWVPSEAQSWILGLSTSLSHNERPEEIGGAITSKVAAIGPYYSTNVSKFTRIRIAGGMQFADFDDPTNGTETANEPFITLDINNQLNRFTSQVLRIGHESGLNDITNAYVADFIRHSFSFSVSPRTNLSTTVYYEQQADNFGETQEDLVRSGASIHLQHRLNSQITLYAGYTYGQSDSTLLAGTAGSIRDPNDPTQIRNSPGTDLKQETFTFDISFPFAQEIDLVLGYRRLRTISSDPNGNFVENRGSINFSYNF